MPLSYYYRNRIERAINEEHLYQLCENTCDIGIAVQNRLWAWAAQALSDGTECPITRAVIAEFIAQHGRPLWDQMVEEDRRELVQLDHVKCPKCNATAYDTAPTTCGSCGEVLEHLKKIDKGSARVIEVNNGYALYGDYRGKAVFIAHLGDGSDGVPVIDGDFPEAYEYEEE